MGKGEEVMPEFGFQFPEFGFRLLASLLDDVRDLVQVTLDGFVGDRCADMFSPFCNARSDSARG